MPLPQKEKEEEEGKERSGRRSRSKRGRRRGRRKRNKTCVPLKNTLDGISIGAQWMGLSPVRPTSCF